MNSPDYLISTPENVDLHLELAGLGNRIIACLIDTLLTYAIIIIIGFACLICAGVISLLPLAERVRIGYDLCILGLGIFATMVIFFGYYIFFEGAWGGQSPGKKIVGIRVIEQTGQPVSWTGSFIRNLIRTADLGFFLIGLVIMFIDQQERRLGDLAAGTLVIRERVTDDVGAIIDLRSHLTPPSFIDTGCITPSDYDLLFSFLQRRSNLSRSQRPLVARRIEKYLRKVLHQPDSNESPETFLENVYSAYQARGQGNDKSTEDYSG